MKTGKIPIVIFSHVLIGWILCGAIMGIGRQITTMENTLIIHAAGVPAIFAVISSIYFEKVNYSTPLQTAIIFVSFVIFMDIFVVAMIIEKSFEMFKSVLGTWIPIPLIFLSTYLTGTVLDKR
jgi:hypothetical protein